MLSPGKISPNNDAWTLLALRSAPSSPTNQSNMLWNQSDDSQGEPVARFDGKDFGSFTWRSSKRQVIIGRSSSKGDVDINMGHSSFVSRNHFQVFSSDGGCPGGLLRFFVTCSGKNGIFVDGIFQRKGAAPMELPKKCTLRFPSTAIKIQFQALAGASGSGAAVGGGESEIKSESISSAQSLPPPVTTLSPFKPHLQPLHISIPPRRVQSFVSPCPSPTGTISAANSCPTSPRGGSGSRTAPPLFDIPSAAFAAVHARSRLSTAGTEDVLEEEVVDIRESYGSLEGDDDSSVSPRGGKAKPPFSYAQLIVQAITSHPDRQLTLSGIYSYISKHYPYYRPSDKGWQNSIRHNLSLNRFFMKVARSQEEPGKGSFWRIDPNSEIKLMEQAFRRRRQRVVSSFRSAPVSPSSVADGVFTSDSAQQGLVSDVYATECSSESLAESQARVSSILSTNQHQPLLSQRIVQLSNDIRFIQSAPGSPQSGAILHPLLMSQIMSTSSAGNNLIYQSASLPSSSSLNVRSGLYASPQTAAGTLAKTEPKDGDKPAVVLLNSQQLSGLQFGNGALTGGAETLHPSLSNSNQSVAYGGSPVTLIQTNTLAQNQALIIQRLLQQGAVVVGRMPTADDQQRSVYTLPSSQAGITGSESGSVQLFVGAPVVQPKSDSSGVSAQPQVLMMPGGAVSYGQNLSASTTLTSANKDTRAEQQSGAELQMMMMQQRPNLSTVSAAALTGGAVQQLHTSTVKTERPSPLKFAAGGRQVSDPAALGYTEMTFATNEKQQANDLQQSKFELKVFGGVDQAQYISAMQEQQQQSTSAAATNDASSHQSLLNALRRSRDSDESAGNSSQQDSHNKRARLDDDAL